MAQGLMSMSTTEPKRILQLYAMLKASGVKATTPAIADYVKRACQILDDDGYSQEEISTMMGDHVATISVPETTKELSVA
jgi:hypothetical protein